MYAKCEEKRFNGDVASLTNRESTHCKEEWLAYRHCVLTVVQQKQQAYLERSGKPGRVEIRGDRLEIVHDDVPAAGSEPKK